VQPKRYSKKEHGIELDHIDAQALYVLKRLRTFGYTSYLVGGGIRDLLLKKKPKDFDIATLAKPSEIKSLFPSSILIGKRFRLAHIRFRKKIIEVSTFRSGDILNGDLITEDNIWGSPEEDVLRRDFTINGLFYDSEKEVVIDYVGGYLDIKNKLLRTIGSPLLRFKQDPVRMIRCLKFQARFAFAIDKETDLALTECKEEIIKSSPTRILEEMLRMLESGSSKSFFQLMNTHGLMQQILPEMAKVLKTKDGGIIYNYLEVVDKTIPYTPLERPVLFACLLFPLLERSLQVHRGKGFHLGDAYQKSNFLINKMFCSFFCIPRRFRIRTVELLVSHYRLTIFYKKKRGCINLFRIPEFHLVMQFIYLRSQVEVGDADLEQWVSMYEKMHKKRAKKDGLQKSGFAKS